MHSSPEEKWKNVCKRKPLLTSLRSMLKDVIIMATVGKSDFSREQFFLQVVQNNAVVSAKSINLACWQI